jgi:hypothetical protein
MEDVVLVAPEQVRVLGLFDLEIALHGEIDDGGGDVAGLDGVGDERAALGGAHAGGRLIHGGDGHAGAGIASLVPPHGEHDDEREQRQKDDGVAAQEPRQAGEEAGRSEDALGDEDVDGEAAAHGQGVGGFNRYLRAVDGGADVLLARAVGAGESLGAQAARGVGR